MLLNSGHQKHLLEYILKFLVKLNSNNDVSGLSWAIFCHLQSPVPLPQGTVRLGTVSVLSQVYSLSGHLQIWLQETITWEKITSAW